MSKEITITANNNARRILVLANDNATLQDVCEHEEVIEFFMAADAYEVADSIEAVDGRPLPESYKDMIMRASVDDNTVVSFDLEGELNEVPDVDENDDDADDDYDDDEDPQAITGTRGVVSVITSSGLQTTHVPVDNGLTTVNDAVFNSVVRARSGMTDTQLSACVIYLNGEEITAEEASVRTVKNGDEIVMAVRVASKNA